MCEHYLGVSTAGGVGVGVAGAAGADGGPSGRGARTDPRAPELSGGCIDGGTAIAGSATAFEESIGLTPGCDDVYPLPAGNGAVYDPPLVPPQLGPRQGVGKSSHVSQCVHPTIERNKTTADAGNPLRNMFRILSETVTFAWTIEPIGSFLRPLAADVVPDT